MRVLAVDLATRSGYAVVESGPKLLEAGAIDLHALRVYEQRLLILFHRVLELIVSNQPLDGVFYESPPGWQHQTTANTLRTLWQLGAIVQLAVAYSGLRISVWGINPRDWQAAIIGRNGRREENKHLAKEQVRLRVGYETADPDIADAICQAIYGLGMLHLGMLGPRVGGQNGRSR